MSWNSTVYVKENPADYGNKEGRALTAKFGGTAFNWESGKTGFVIAQKDNVSPAEQFEALKQEMGKLPYPVTMRSTPSGQPVFEVDSTQRKPREVSHNDQCPPRSSPPSNFSRFIKYPAVKIAPVSR